MRRVTATRPAWWGIVAAAAGAALLVAACGSGGGVPAGGGSPSGGGTSAAASPAAPGPNAALCQDAAALRASLGKLTHVSVGAGAANEIKADLADVKTKLTSFAAEAHGQWQAQTSALKSALTKLQTAAADLATHPSASTVSGVVTALGGVTTATSNLLAALSTACPSTSPSPST
jgi:hypothetical protein